jgi:hypothetical protein
MLNLWLSIVLVRRIGAVGVIGGTILSYLLVLVAPQTIIVRNVWRRELRGKPARFTFRFLQSLSRGND